MPQAARFDASTDQLTATTGLPAGTTWTVTCWVYTIGLGTRFRNAWTLNDSGLGQGATVTFRDFADALQASDYSTYGGAGVNPLTASTATWYQTALVVSGANATFYRAAEGNALVSGAVADFTPPTTPGRLYLGGDAFASWLDGRVAAFKMWQAALNSTEVAAEFTQYRAVRTTNLLRDHPFDGATTDFSGNSNTLTAGSTAVSYEAGPTTLPLTASAPPIQPTLVSDRGTVADATAATTSAVTLTSPTTIAVGNYLLARVAVDNSGTNGAAPGCTVTDPRSNTWTVLGPALVDPGAAAAGATAYLAYTKVGTAYQAADALTFNWGGISTTAKAVVVEEWQYIHPTTPVAVAAVTANAAASAAVSVANTPTGPGQMIYTCLATEGIAADTFTGDADTTLGTWTTLTSTASANATATNNQRVAGQYKVVTGGGAQTWDATITNRDWAALAVVFNPAPVYIAPRRRGPNYRR